MRGQMGPAFGGNRSHLVLTWQRKLDVKFNYSFFSSFRRESADEIFYHVMKVIEMHRRFPRAITQTIVYDFLSTSVKSLKRWTCLFEMNNGRLATRGRFYHVFIGF